MSLNPLPLMRLTHAAVLAAVALPVMAGQALAQDYCREYQRQVTIGGRVQQAYGTACMDGAGDWRIAHEQAARGPVVWEAPAPVVIRERHEVGLWPLLPLGVVAWQMARWDNHHDHWRPERRWEPRRVAWGGRGGGHGRWRH